MSNRGKAKAGPDRNSEKRTEEKVRSMNMFAHASNDDARQMFFQDCSFNAAWEWEISGHSESEGGAPTAWYAAATYCYCCFFQLRPCDIARTWYLWVSCYTYIYIHTYTY